MLFVQAWTGGPGRYVVDQWYKQDPSRVHDAFSNGFYMQAWQTTGATFNLSDDDSNYAAAFGSADVQIAIKDAWENGKAAYLPPPAPPVVEEPPLPVVPPPEDSPSLPPPPEWVGSDPEAPPQPSNTSNGTDTPFQRQVAWRQERWQFWLNFAIRASTLTDWEQLDQAIESDLTGRLIDDPVFVQDVKRTMRDEAARANQPQPPPPGPDPVETITTVDPDPPIYMEVEGDPPGEAPPTTGPVLNWHPGLEGLVSINAMNAADADPDGPLRAWIIATVEQNGKSIEAAKLRLRWAAPATKTGGILVAGLAGFLLLKGVF